MKDPLKVRISGNIESCNKLHPIKVGNPMYIGDTFIHQKVYCEN